MTATINSKKGRQKLLWFYKRNVKEKLFLFTLNIISFPPIFYFVFTTAKKKNFMFIWSFNFISNYFNSTNNYKNIQKKSRFSIQEIRLGRATKIVPIMWCRNNNKNNNNSLFLVNFVDRIFSFLIYFFGGEIYVIMRLFVVTRVKGQSNYPRFTTSSYLPPPSQLFRFLVS